jgi:hypothetical protein
MVTNAVEEVLELDVRLIRTLREIVRPGALTNAYLGGRRTGYVPPLRQLLIGGFLLLVALSAFQTVRPEEAGVSVEFDSDTRARIVAARDSLQQVETVWAGVQGTFLTGALKADRNKTQLNRAFVERLSLAAFLLIPVFALLLRGLFPARLYAEHFVCTLHLHAFLFGAGGLALLAGVVARWLGAPALPLQVFAVAAAAGLLAYLWTTLYRVYRDGAAWTTVKFAGLLGAYLLVIVAVILVQMVITLYGMG